LNANEWTTVKNNYDVNGDGSFDSNDAWTVLPQESPGSEFTEFQFGGDGGSLAPAASLDLGNSWIQSPTEDLQIEVILSDNRVNTYSIEYVNGPAGGFEVGDLNFDGFISALDWPFYNAGRGVDLSSMSSAAAYQMGDLDGDMDNDIVDFVLFKAYFVAENGAAAWAALASVPEPTSGLLLMTALALLTGIRPRRGAKVSGILFRRRRNMKSPSAAILCSLVCFTALATQAKATTITFSGDSNADIPEFYGSNIAADAAGFVTTDGSGATPNIGLTWFPADDNVWEFHNSTNFDISPLSPAVAQMDVDLSGHSELPPDPTITFSPAAGFAVKINSLDIGQALDQTEPAYSWTINIKQSSNDAIVFTHDTPTMGAGDTDSVAINFTGDLGRDYYLHFDDGGANTVRGAIDNLSFGETNTGLTSMNLIVNTTLGEITLENDTGLNYTIDSYEITSASDSLDPVGWNSLEDQDYEGNGAPDNGNGWEEAGGIGAGQLIESYLLGDSTIADGTTISLGSAFDFDKPGVEQNLTFGYHLAGDDPFLSVGTVEYISPILDTDFDDDGDTDGQDFLIWQRGFGLTGSASNSQGDANGDLDVDAQDLSAWRALFGSTSAVPNATAVPEPGTASLFGFALFGLVFILGRQSKAWGQPVTIRCSSCHVGRIAAVALIFLVSRPAMAAKTTDRLYEFGEHVNETASQGGAISETFDSESQTGSQFDDDAQNLSQSTSTSRPKYANVGATGLNRPGAPAGDFGAQFDGTDDVVWGIPLNRPDETAGPSITGIGPLIFDFPYNYDTITARGLQMWVYPDASAIGTEGSPTARQGIVFDTIAAGGVSITADGKWTQLNDSIVTDGIIEATVPVVGDQWYHVMHHVYPSSHPGAPKLASGFLLEKGFTSVVYVDGIAVSVNNGNPVPFELDNGSRVGVLAVGAEEISNDGFDPLFDNYFKGVVDDLEMYVFGDNSSVPTFPSGQDYGTFAIFSDNGWITDQIATLPGGVLNMGDINRDGSVNSGDVTALVAGWRMEKRLKGSSVEVNVGDWETWGWGDLNVDGLVDLEDAILLNDALIAAGQESLNFDLLSAVPEPASFSLGLLGWITLCLSRRRRRHCG
jgi:hypothetical protein